MPTYKVTLTDKVRRTEWFNKTAVVYVEAPDRDSAEQAVEDTVDDRLAVVWKDHKAHSSDQEVYDSEVEAVGVEFDYPVQLRVVTDEHGDETIEVVKEST